MADDLRFWQTAGEPVLAHDPFMTLVSLVFCGDDFPRSREQLLPLVHLLYAVAVVQLPQAAARSAGGLPPGALLDLVRRGTLAFLRRCALLLHVLFGGLEEFSAAAGSAADGAGSGAPDGGGCDGSGAAAAGQVAATGGTGKGRAASGGSRGSGETPKEICLRTLGETAKRTGGGAGGGVGGLGITGGGAGGLAPMALPSSSSSSSHSSPLEQQQQQQRERAAMALDLQECSTWERAFGLPPVRALLARRELAELIASLVTDRGQLRQGKCGEGRKHAGGCGAGVGVSSSCGWRFSFSPRRRDAMSAGGTPRGAAHGLVSTVLLLRGNRYCMWPSPYLDAYGEERGKPLFLSEERYSALASLVASHGLDYSSLVLSRSARWATI
eukprot:jgi/Mesen1/5571/ME000281S04634